MTFLRSMLFNLLFLPFTALACIVGQVLLLGPPARIHAYARGWARGVLWLLWTTCGIGVRIEGREHLPRGAAVIASKHQSTFDAIIWLLAVDCPAYVLKQELIRPPLWGTLVQRCGHIAVERKGGVAALRGLVRASEPVLAAQRKIVIFPEGTRTEPGQRARYHPGVAAIAEACRVPLVPVATDSGRFWRRRAFHKQPGTITVSILPPLPANLPRAALMERLEAVIEAETARLYDSPGSGSGHERGALFRGQ
ncbi:lysophospholipid acyltransferase family protein [Plastoroseomonas hellenica]|uniref:lysophospholipid acyltransferase family protein n=1 Tax=Plastoroseomonas hellenica TaxID=2687306 RepID=UPI001BAC50A4|nr:lysophospholipid acyltransferase family protein [Plastoroseomonas hellenica]MBR0641485.1 1-acyl-sn-glycerol-3-phosphate acyltransferase [Plastoroseomonas hellenica]